MAVYGLDLHVHTVLSPCAEVEMIPPFIVRQAEAVGLDAIAIADHNSAENVVAVIEAATGSSVRVLPGIECESVEGVHILCLFDDPNAALAMQETIYAALPDLPNKADVFGAQFVVDAEGEFIRYNERLLLISTALSIEEIDARVGSLGGLAIPAHVDRRAYGLYGVLGFFPEAPYFEAAEISRHLSPEEAIEKYPDLGGRQLFQSSDAHRLSEIGSVRTQMELKSRTVAALKAAISIPNQWEGR